jgi:hypothetical protein
MFRQRHHGRLAHQRDARWSGLRQAQDLAQRAIVIVARQFAVRLSRLGMPMAVSVFVLVAANLSVGVSQFADIPVRRTGRVVVTVTNSQRHSPDEPDGPESGQTAAKVRAVHANDSSDFADGTSSRSITCRSSGCEGAIFSNARF